MKTKQERMEKLEREEKAAAEAFERWMKEDPEGYEEYCRYHEYLDRQYLEEQEEIKMNKQEKIKKLIANEIVIEATSPWDGEARFDYYSVVVHKYDNEDLSFIEENDPRISEAAGRIFKMIDPKEWDRLLEYYLSDEPYVHPEGERNARPRGGRK